MTLTLNSGAGSALVIKFLPPLKCLGKQVFLMENPMSVKQDFKEMFKILNEESVEYLVVGAHAVIVYTEPRYTKDLYIWINPTLQNAERVWKALAKFGAPLKGIKKKDFTDKDIIYQIGIAPVRIDIINDISSVDFPSAYKSCIKIDYDGVSVPVIGKEELIKAKISAGRDQDLLDVKKLTASKKKSPR